jgi:Glycosyl hydrolase family 76
VFCAALCAAAALPVPGPWVGRAAAADSSAPWLRLARQANAALLRHFGTHHSLFHKHPDSPPGRDYAGVWAAAHAIDGSLALARQPGGGVSLKSAGRLVHALRFYWDGDAPTPGYDKGVRSPFGAGGYKFYDDNVWVGLTLIGGFDLSGDPRLLRRASQVFELEKAGWDLDSTHPYPGGVFWTQSPKSDDRNTVSTAGAAQLGAELYLRTGRDDYLAWAIAMHDWVNRNLRDADGLYWDHVNLRGRVNTVKWSYNQGLMLGTDRLLFRATGNGDYLREAQSIADAAVDYFDVGGVLESQRPIFNAIFIKNLLSLYSVAPNPAYLQLAGDYARFLQGHVNRRGLLHVNGSGVLLDQASLVQVNAYLAAALTQ